MEEYCRIEADIDLSAIQYNIEQVKANVKPETKIMVVIKADGYGHGAIAVAKALENLADAYAVAVLDEALVLRRAGIKKDILILGFTPEKQYSELIANDLIQTVFQYQMAEQLSHEAKQQKKKVRVHIKIDTGMNRIGFSDKEETVDMIRRMIALENLEVEGIFTHFAGADEADKTSVNRQIERFQKFLNFLKAEEIIIPLCHASNSAGIIDLPQANYNMVRCGIATYGLYPSNEVEKEQMILKPALSLKTNVIFVKEVEAGVGISYNSTFITKRKTVIATLPVGYADGYPRQLSSKGRVLIHGKRAPIIGRICMDQMMVDVTDIPCVKEGDTVILAGTEGKETISVEELAFQAGTFHYELICNIAKRVPRVYYQNGKKVGIMDYNKNAENAVELYS